MPLGGKLSGRASLDASGTVLAWDEELSEMLATASGVAVGSNLFTDVLPSTAVPAFRGRVAAALRQSSPARFRFVFTHMAEPLAAAVTAEPIPSGIRLTVADLGSVPLPPSRAATHAANTVGQRLRAEPVDPLICEREPIHIPGAVQPHVALLACDPLGEMTIRVCSDNLFDLLDIGEAPLGKPLASFLPPGVAQELHGLPEALPPAASNARIVRRIALAGASAVRLMAHRHNGHLLVELERLMDPAEEAPSDAAVQVRGAISRLRAAETLEAAADATAVMVRSLTAFERVLVYRFDSDWNGSAIAEDKAASWTSSLLGLHFPASDIPAQARALYARSPSRFVADRDAVPATLLATPDAAAVQLDLTYAYCRALSPVHLEYQRNLGVNGSMSLSILVNGKLWGLIIGHHRQPHLVPPEARAFATIVADAFALRVHELETTEHLLDQQSTLATQNRLLGQMAMSDDFIAALADGTDGASTLADLYRAGGAVVVAPDRVVTMGAVPPEPSLRPLVDWLRQHAALPSRVFATDNLAALYPPAAAWHETASGMMAAFIGDEAGGRERALLWFRPEVVAEIAWGGDRAKTVLADGLSRAVLPRRSFERWVEERRGWAEPWAEWQIGLAGSLAGAIEGVILRQERRIRTLEAKQAELTAALEQKDVLAREVDHRVKNSLQIVANVMLLQGRAVADPVAKAAFQDTYARVMSVARVHDSLQQSDDVASVDLGQTLRQLCQDLAAGMTGADRRLDVRAESGVMVSSQTAVALSLVATELVTNALKYAYAPDEPGGVVVTVRTRPPTGLELQISDRGRGLPEGWSDRPRASKGGGLGMRVIRAMLQQIGAEMEVATDLPGACFTVRA